MSVPQVEVPEQPKLTPQEELAVLREAQDAYADVSMLLMQNRDTMFYGMFLLKTRKQWTKQIPTAGVNVTDRVNLIINPHFFMSGDTQFRMELLLHEMEHVLRLHPVRGAKVPNKKVMNVAMDADINQPLKSLHKIGVTFDKVDQAIKEAAQKYGRPYKNLLKRDGIAEENYEIIMGELQDPNGGDGKGGQFGEVDDHSSWEESTSPEIAEAIIRDAANKTASAVGAGNLPANIQRHLTHMNKSKVCWRQQLQQYACNTLQFDFTRTRSRRNRRTGLINPGRRKAPQLNIVHCTDSSGSVSDEAFAQVFIEIAKIAEMGAKITMIDADCVVQSVYEYDPTKHKVPVRFGGGGTAYQPAITKAKELRPDLIIYSGDMDSADIPVDPKIPFLWLVINSTQKPPGNFGKTIYVNTQDGK